MSGVDYEAVFAASPTPLLLISPGGVIVDANLAYARISGRQREQLIGAAVGEMFPDNPDDPTADGRENLAASLRRVIESGVTDTMAIQRYDVADPDTGTFVERYWSPTNAPVLDDAGHTIAVVHRVEEITEFVEQRRSHPGQDEPARVWRARLQEAEFEVHTRAKDLRATNDASTAAVDGMSVLAEVTSAMSAAATLDDLATAVFGQMLPALGADVGGFAIGDHPSTSRFVPVPGTDPGGFVGDIAVLDEHTPGGAAVLTGSTGRRVVLTDRTACLTQAPDLVEIVDATGCEAWAGLPLRVADEVIGSLTVGWKQRRPMSAPDVLLWEALSSCCAAALHRIRAAEAGAAPRRPSNTEPDLRHAREQILLRLLTASTQVLSTESKLAAIADAAVPVLSDVCAVYVLDPPLPAGRRPDAPIVAWRLAAPTSDGVVGPVPGRVSTWSDGDPAGAAIAAAATVVFTYTPAAPPSWARAAGVYEAIHDGLVHCTALAPVIIDGHAHAFVAFGAGPDRPPYREHHRELFDLVAAQTAIAIRQGHRYDHVRSTALTLQRALLTAPPEVPGIDIVVRYRPAGEAAEVGGDWHDVFTLHEPGPAGDTTNHDLAVVVGDVAGHDVSAAAIMGQLRSMLRGFTVHNPGAPDHALTALNHVIRQMRLTTLTTCIVAHLRPDPADPTGLELTWSNAGHPPPVIVHPDATTTVLTLPRDPALGPANPRPRTSAAHRLPRGSTLLLFSDGLFERRAVAYDDCFDQLLDQVGAANSLDTEALCDELLSSAPHDDDIVLIAVRPR